MYLGVALNFAYAFMTLLTASRKSFSVAILRLALMANMPASVQTLLISAPEGKRTSYITILISGVGRSFYLLDYSVLSEFLSRRRLQKEQAFAFI